METEAEIWGKSRRERDRERPRERARERAREIESQRDRERVRERHTQRNMIVQRMREREREMIIIKTRNPDAQREAGREGGKKREKTKKVKSLHKVSLSLYFLLHHTLPSLLLLLPALMPFSCPPPCKSGIHLNRHKRRKTEEGNVRQKACRVLIW